MLLPKDLPGWRKPCLTSNLPGSAPSMRSAAIYSVSVRSKQELTRFSKSPQKTRRETSWTGPLTAGSRTPSPVHPTACVAFFDGDHATNDLAMSFVTLPHVSPSIETFRQRG